jgi:hypothetical protein
MRGVMSSKPAWMSAAGIASVAVLAVALTLCVSAMSLDAFVVVDGLDCDGCIHRQRGCAGFRWIADVRSGSSARCVGIPVGPWYCFRRMSDGQFRPIPCPP